MTLCENSDEFLIGSYTKAGVCDFNNFFMNDKASRLNEREDTVVSTHIIFVSYAATYVNGEGEKKGKCL